MPNYLKTSSPIFQSAFGVRLGSGTQDREAAARADELLTPIEVTEQLKDLREQQLTYAVVATDNDQKAAV